MAHHLDFKPEELVATLKHSDDTFLLVEGTDDVMIYRWLIEQIGIEKISFQPCYGRENLVIVFNRREEFKKCKMIFVADKDTYVYSKVPDEYEEIIWTSGYSIENDVYEGRKIEQLLDKSELKSFEKARASFIKYYAFQLENFRNEVEFQFKHHPKSILKVDYALNLEAIKQYKFTEPKKETVEYLSANYDLLVRGKSLFDLLLIFLSHSKRPVKHNRFSLLEHTCKLMTNNALPLLLEQINKQLSND
jgi:Protein of unknown function (DUF4435)